eukprot:16434305-Heterocapsa_arctica.AAC.1
MGHERYAALKSEVRTWWSFRVRSSQATKGHDEVRDGAHLDSSGDVDCGVDEGLSEVVDASEPGDSHRGGLQDAALPCVWRAVSGKARVAEFAHSTGMDVEH